MTKKELADDSDHDRCQAGDSSDNEATRRRLATLGAQVSNGAVRGLILFTLGSTLTFVLNVMQMEYKSNLFPSNVLLFLQNDWYFLPFCGLAAGK